ncbi:MAG: alpha/beta hydrolase, partial [Alphaproteobacteria bacterium]|nr:alpha/beta hydrolase [Alphaproteobacteria bacterium]
MDTRATTRTEGQEHWTTSGGKNLALWAKKAAGERRGTVLFVHGSSMPTRPTFDLQVDGIPEASVMDWFGSRGFDTWT